MVDKLLGLYVNQLSPIIQILFVVILGLIFVLLYLAVKKGKEQTEMPQSIEGLENTLRKVIESQQHLGSAKVDSGATVGTAAATATVQPGAVAGADPAAMAKLQSDIAAREKREKELLEKIGQLEKSMAETTSQAAAVSAAQAAAPAADASGLESRIKDLEARLKEYEIIEDDIANLSLYKEENTRLKNELNRLSGPNAATEAVAEVAGTDSTGAPPEVVDKGPSLESAIEAAGGLPEVAVPAVEPVAETAPSEPVAPQEDLVGALAAALEQNAAPAPADAPAVAAVPATPEAPPEPAGGPAEISFDPDKLAEEATQLKEDPNATPAAEEGDSGQKLIDEFENFMKESR